MSKKYLIVGGGAAAARLKTLCEENKIITVAGFISVPSYEYN
jgi:siroheme synthase (precorrin-2 oxidase/ferrochelatase)